MGRKRQVKGECLRSEAFMKELFGMNTANLRALAKKQGWTTAHVTTRVRLYDIRDAEETFERFQVMECEG